MIDLPSAECYDPQIGTHRDCGGNMVYLSLGMVQRLQTFRTSFAFSYEEPKWWVVALESWQVHKRAIENAMKWSLGGEWCDYDPPENTVAEGSGPDDIGWLPYRTTSGLREFRRANKYVINQHELGLLALKGRLLRLTKPTWVRIGSGDSLCETWQGSWISEIGLGVQCDKRTYDGPSLRDAFNGITG
ncbi:MAG: hypothetical protein KAJ06_00840 [Gammaproteobacteria bacterium]|nr:hypothetical protein [Gammaproteobacteria bacterium]